MRLPGLFALAFLALSCAVHAGEHAPRDPTLVQHELAMAKQDAFRKRFLADLPSMRVERMHYIDPSVDQEMESADRIHGYRVTGQAAPADASAATALKEGLREIVASRPKYAAACFDPHHALTLSDRGDRYHVLVCFDCGNFLILSGDGAVLLSESFGGIEERTWDGIFAGAGLKRQDETTSRK